MSAIQFLINAFSFSCLIAQVRSANTVLLLLNIISLLSLQSSSGLSHQCLNSASLPVEPLPVEFLVYVKQVSIFHIFQFYYFSFVYIVAKYM